MAIMIKDEAHAIEQLAEWYKIAAQIKVLAKVEKDLRIALARFYVPNAKEGTNKVTLPDGAELVVTEKYNYKVDKALLNSIGLQLKEVNVNIDDLIENKPSLKIGEYRKLDEDALDILSQCVTYTIGTPGMEVKVK